MQFTQCYDHYRKVLGRVMDINTLKEYLNIHIISLKQDRELADGVDDINFVYLTGQITASNHILEVINER